MNEGIRDIMLKGLDQQVGALKSAQVAARRPVRGWLRAVRESSGATQAGLAAKLGMSRQSYAQLETAEARRAISLKSLQRAAEAMECEVVYFVVPRAGVAESFADLAARHKLARAYLAATEHSMALEGQAVGDLKPVRPAPPTA